MSSIYDTGASAVGNAGSSGSGAIGAFDPIAWTNATQSGLGSIKNSQDTTYNAFQNAFKNQISSQPSATDYYNQGMDAFNVKPLQDTANTLNNTMLNAPNSNLNAAKGFNVDQGQVDQKTSQDLQRLGPAAVAAQNNATTAQGNAMAYANNGIQQNQMNIIPYQDQQSYLLDAFARQQSGFSSTQQSQLDALTAKMNAGEKLSEAEMAAYSSLSTAEASYQSAVASANATVQAAQAQSQYHVVNPSQGLFDANTGKTTPYMPNATLPANAVSY